MLLHPDGATAFLLSELSSTLDTLAIDGEAFRSVQRVSTLPADYRGESLGGHIGLNSARDRIYVTNRGHDSIAVFDISGGTLKLLQHVPSGGASPRHFLLDEHRKMMLVANEDGGNVTGFRVEANGTLSPSGLNIAVQGPAFLFHRSAAVP